MARPIENLVGRRFHKLTVIGPPVRSDGKTTWLCQCACGGISKARADHLKNGNTKSCGCHATETLRENAIVRGGLLPGESSAKRLFYSYRGRSRKRRLTFELSLDDALKLFVSDCYYCGVTPSQVVRRNDLNGEFVYNGIDRLDNSIGYTKANSVSCCWRCNRAKLNDDLKGFKEWVRCVYENLFIEPS